MLNASSCLQILLPGNNRQVFILQNILPLSLFFNIPYWEELPPKALKTLGQRYLSNNQNHP